MDNFLELPSEDNIKDCYRAFIAATSNDAIACNVCVVCAREKWANEGAIQAISDIPNVHNRLTPFDAISSPDCWEGMVLLRERLHGEPPLCSGWVCHECVSALRNDRMPKYALANNLWIGSVPHELRILTISEQILIGRHHPHCYIFKLFPRDPDVHLPPNLLQSGMMGNVSLYEMNTEAIVEMLEGQLMPYEGSTLASVLAITFIGAKTIPKNWLKATFRVRRRAVYEALLWLKDHNSVYEDITIDRARLNTLPEDGVPDEIIALVRHEKDVEIAEKERETYVPPLEIDERNAMNLGNTSGTLDNLAGENSNAQSKSVVFLTIGKFLMNKI